MGGLRKLFDSECLEKHPNEEGCPASRLFPLASVCFEIDVSNGGDPARVNKPTQPTGITTASAAATISSAATIS
jgi:hypothetical protein